MPIFGRSYMTQQSTLLDVAYIRYILGERRFGYAVFDVKLMQLIIWAENANAPRRQFEIRHELPLCARAKMDHESDRERIFFSPAAAMRKIYIFKGKIFLLDILHQFNCTFYVVIARFYAILMVVKIKQCPQKLSNNLIHFNAWGYFSSGKKYVLKFAIAYIVKIFHQITVACFKLI